MYRDTIGMRTQYVQDVFFEDFVCTLIYSTHHNLVCLYNKCKSAFLTRLSACSMFHFCVAQVTSTNQAFSLCLLHGLELQMQGKTGQFTLSFPEAKWCSRRRMSFAPREILHCLAVCHCLVAHLCNEVTNTCFAERLRELNEKLDRVSHQKLELKYISGLPAILSSLAPQSKGLRSPAISEPDFPLSTPCNDCGLHFLQLFFSSQLSTAFDYKNRAILMSSSPPAPIPSSVLCLTLI